MTDEKLMQSTLLALTMQNVTGEAGGLDSSIVGDFAMCFDGIIVISNAIIGEYQIIIDE